MPRHLIVGDPITDLAALGSDKQVYFNNAGTSAAATGLTYNPSGTVTTATTLNLTNPLGISFGGTGLSSTSQNFVFAGPTLGGGAPTWRALVAGDIPSLDTSKLTSGTLSVSRGGTGIATLTANRIPYGNGTSAFQSSSSLTFDGTTFIAPDTQITGMFRAEANSSTVPGGSQGLAVSWNRTGGQAEVAVWNQFTGFTPTYSFQWLQKTGASTFSDLLWLASWGAILTPNGNGELRLGTDASVAFGRASSGRGFINGDMGMTGKTEDGTADAASINQAKTVNTNTNSSHRIWGLKFSAKAQGSANYTDTTAAVAGFEGLSEHNGTGTVTKQLGGLVYFAVTGGGTTTAGIGHYCYPILVSSGTLTDGSQLTIGSLPSVTANSQIRSGLRFETAMPGNGGFIGTTRQQIWLAYNSTSASDGIGFGASNDVQLYRSAAGELKSGGRIVGADGLTTLTVAGVVSDASFATTPPNGTIAIDTTNLKIYVRIAGAWKSVVVA